MAFSPTDPTSAHSLWLQLRNAKRKRRHRWRSDWTPLWVSLLLFGVVLILYTIMPSTDAVARAEQAPHEDAVSQERPRQGALGP